MRHPIFFSTVIGFLSFSAIVPACAQWVQTNGNFGGFVRCLAVSGTNLFAGTDSGVFLSTDSSESWIAVNSGLAGAGVEVLEVSGTNLLAAGNGVYLSTDNGANWNAAGLQDTLVNALAVMGTNLFAGTQIGAFISTNNGASWTAADTTLPEIPVEAFAVSGTNLFAGTEDGGVFLSTNYGTNWTAANSGLTDLAVYDLAVIGANLFAGTGSNGVFISTNNGTSWGAANSGLTDNRINALAVSGTNLFAGMDGGGSVFLSTNNGTSWTAVNSGLTDDYVTPLAANGTYLFAGTDTTGVWRRPLSEMTNPPSILLQEDFSGQLDPRITPASLGLTPRGIVSDSIFGAGAKAWCFGLSSCPASCFGADTSALIIDFGQTVHIDSITFDEIEGDGRNWGSEGYLWFDSISWPGPVGDTAEAYGRVPSDDGGVDSTYRSHHYQIGINSRRVTFDTWDITDSCDIYMTNIIIYGEPLPTDTQAVPLLKDTSLAVSGDSATYRAHRIDFVNASSGTLTILSAALTDSGNRFSISQILPGIPDTIPPGGTFSMIVNFTGNDSGTVYLDTLVLTIDPNLEISSYYVYLKGNSFGTAPMGVSQNSSAASADLRSYPNPFSQSATISFSSPESGYADVSVVNLLGVEVARLFSGEMDAGEHSFTWDASGVAPGMYECVVRMNGNVHQIPILCGAK